MSTATLSPEIAATASRGVHQKVDALLLGAMEGLLLALLFLAPWGFGAVHPSFELLLDAGIALLLFLWSARILIQGRLMWQSCPVALCLAALFATAVWQLVPLSSAWLLTLSPHTAELYRVFFPPEAEVVPSGGEAVPAFPAAGSTISLCPGVTQREALRLLAVLLLFVVVRSNLTGTAQLRRLCWVALANGVLLSLFALVQFFTWGSSRVYGLYPTEGSAFGPFICRNHFPYYVNICLGLGLGLLLQSLLGTARRAQPSPRLTSLSGPRSRGARRRRQRSLHHLLGLHGWFQGRDPTKELGVRAVLGQLLQQPSSLALAGALLLLTSAVFFSLSRGGALALVGALLAAGVVQVTSARSFFKVSALAILFALPLILLLSWFGMDRMEARWENVFDAARVSVGRLERPTGGHLAEDLLDRFSLWRAVWPSFQQLPFFGSGYGTFEFTEVLYRSRVSLEGTLYDHAHNDYLEALLEGGIAGAIPVLILIGLLLLAGYRSVQRQREHSAGWLATGLFFGLIAVLIHSFVDFGLHIPAIAFLATVICAHLSAQGGRGERASQVELVDRQAGQGTQVAAAPQGRVLSAVAVLTLAVLGVLLVEQGWRRHRASRFRAAAISLAESTNADDRPLYIAYLQAAVAEEPGEPQLRLELARAQMALYLDEEARCADQNAMLARVQALALLPADGPTQAGIAPVLQALTAAAAQAQMLHDRARPDRQRLLAPALTTYLAVRSLCPILTEPHVRLAAHVGSLQGAQPASAYLARATLLSPVNPSIWYLDGKQHFVNRSWDSAWHSWQRCLALSEDHRSSILIQARQQLSEDELREKLLPDQAPVYYAVARELHPSEDDLEEQRPYLEKALALLDQQSEPLRAEDHALRAALHLSMGDKKRALASYQTAIRLAPLHLPYRLEYARLLHDEGQLRQADIQLQILLSQQPSEEAQELQAEIRRELFRKF